MEISKNFNFAIANKSYTFRFHLTEDVSEEYVRALRKEIELIEDGYAGTFD